MFDNQTKKFCAAVTEALPNMSEDVMQGWIGNPKGLQKALSFALCPPETEPVPEVVARDFIVSQGKLLVNYSRSISDSVLAGQYDGANDDINDVNFPSTETGEREVDIAMFHFGRKMSSAQVIAEMDKVGYEPAPMKVLLNYGEKNPEE